MPSPPGVHIITKGQWNAGPSKFGGPLRHPLSYIMWRFTETEPCHNLESCTQGLVALQLEHKRFTPDIKYNFMVDSEGHVYEGRGWRTKANLPGRYRDLQYTSLYIGLIGNITDSPPSWKMLRGKKALIKLGMDLQYVDKKILEFDLDVTFNRKFG